MSKEAHHEQKKAQIIDAMIFVMSSRGYAGASVQHIAEKAGLRAGSLHYYFEDKEAILIELLNHLSNSVLRRFRSRKTENPVAKVAAYIDAHLAYGSDADSEEIACWLSISALATHNYVVQEALQEIECAHITLLERLCENALQASGRTTTAKREIALSIYAAIQGVYHLYISAPLIVAHGLAPKIVLDTGSRLLSAQSMSKGQKSTGICDPATF